MVEIPQMPPEDEEGGTDVKGMEIKDLQRLQGTWMVAERLSDDESYNKALELMGFRYLVFLFRLAWKPLEGTRYREEPEIVGA